MILAGTTIALVVVAARSLARSISDPVVTLTDATSHIAEGDLTRRVEVAATNEIGQLARSFNRMTERLAKSIDELTSTTAAKERIESELRVAHDIQMGILPKIFPPFPHRPEFDLHAMLEPAKAVGGDFYDFLLFDDEELYVIIGDVSGKGVPASLFMAVTLTLFRSSVRRGMPPGALLTKLNRDLCVDNTSSVFVTVFCARLDVRTGSLVFANGGHNPPYHVTAVGGTSALPAHGGPVLGLLEQASFGEGALTLAPGDTLVMFTDGITEATNSADELYGDDRLRALLETHPQPARAESIVNAIAADVGRFVGNAPQSDDQTIARRAIPRPGRDRPAVSHHALSITCPNRLAEIGKAAELIEAFGAAHGLSPEVVFKLNLALDEVVTNIISHAYDDEDEHQIAIRVALDGEGVSVRVEDDGRAFNPLDAPRPDLGLDLAKRPIGGLGVHIVRSVMDALEYRREDDRNILVMRKRTGDGSNEGARRIE